MIPDKLLVKAFEKLDALEIGEVLKNTDVKNWDVFIECAKMYIDSHKQGEFNSSYSRFRQALTFSQQIERFQPREDTN